MPRPSQIGKRVAEVPTPALIVYKAAFEANCIKMLNRAKEMGVQLRGQTKTHKTVEGGILQTGGTKRCLVVSSLIEAEMYAEAGFDDILYGYPLLEVDMERNFALAEKLSEYHMMVNNVEAVRSILKHQPPKGKKWSVFLKVDVGYHRAGVPCTNTDQILSIAKLLNENQASIKFQGLYAHCGNSYSGKTPAEVKQLRDGAVVKMAEVGRLLASNGIEVKHQGIGSTPSCSQTASEGASIYTKLTEIHPGNYVFYDLQQEMLGSCMEDEIAAVVVTRVLAHFPGERNQLIIDAGFTALSQQGFDQLGGNYAKIKDHPELKVVGMTQEIGFVQPFDPSVAIHFDKIPVGSMLFLTQYHSCDTASKFPVYYVANENGVIVEEWAPTRGW